MSTDASPYLEAIHFPDSDGRPIGDHTVQFDWVSLLKWGAEAQYADDPDVFVAGDHLIYPVRGDVKTRQAPDAYVAFGRPKGHRGSYKVWHEGGQFPQVVFEVHSPSNTADEMAEKFEFYQKHGAEEYYLIYPDFPGFVSGWVRADGKLVPVPEMNGFVSPRLKWRFEIRRGAVRVFAADGWELRTPVSAYLERDAARKSAEAAHLAEQVAAAERGAAKHAEADAAERAARLAAKLRELGLDPDAV